MAQTLPKFLPPVKQRQVTFRESGGPGRSKAQYVSYLLRVIGYTSADGHIPSPTGSWADTPYIMTDAPLAVIRKVAKSQALTVAK